MPETASLKNGIEVVGFQIVIPSGRFKKNRNLSARSRQPRRPGFGKQPHRGKIDPFEHHHARTPPRRDLPQFIAETQRRRTARRHPQQAFGQRNPVAQQTQFVDERQRAVRSQRIGSHTDIQPVRPQQLHRRAQSRDIPVRTRQRHHHTGAVKCAVTRSIVRCVTQQLWTSSTLRVGGTLPTSRSTGEP